MLELLPRAGSAPPPRLPPLCVQRRRSTSQDLRCIHASRHAPIVITGPVTVQVVVDVATWPDQEPPVSHWPFLVPPPAHSATPAAGGSGVDPDADSRQHVRSSAPSSAAPAPVSGI
jgi:hypothetical protein